MHLSNICFTKQEEEVELANEYKEKIDKYLTILNRYVENLQVIKDNALHLNFEKNVDIAITISNYALSFCEHFWDLRINCDLQELFFSFELIDDNRKFKLKSKNEMFKLFERVFNDFDKNGLMHTNTNKEIITIDEFCNK